MRARDREPAARPARVLRLRLRSGGWPGARGSSSVEYGLIIALIGAVLCIGIGLSVKSMFDGVVQCFVANMQGASDATCQPPAGGGGGGGGAGGGIVPGNTKPTPTVTPTPTSTATP